MVRRGRATANDTAFANSNGYTAATTPGCKRGGANPGRWILKDSSVYHGAGQVTYQKSPIGHKTLQLDPALPAQ